MFHIAGTQRLRQENGCIVDQNKIHKVARKSGNSRRGTLPMSLPPLDPLSYNDVLKGDYMAIAWEDGWNIGVVEEKMSETIIIHDLDRVGEASLRGLG